MINQKAKEWHDDYERKNQSLEGQAKTFGLSPADLDFNVETAIEASMTDEDESGMQAVRNIRDTIEVILIKTDFEENIDQEIKYLEEDLEREQQYTPSCTAHDYSPSNPWDAPGMCISDFI